MTCNRLCAALSVFFVAFFSAFAAHAASVPLNPLNPLNPPKLTNPPAAHAEGLKLQNSQGATSASLSPSASTAVAETAFMGPLPAPEAAVQTAAVELKSVSLPPSLALSVSDLPPVAQDGEKKVTLVQRLVDAGSEMTQQTLQDAAAVENTVEGWQQKGMASWYGPGFHGRKTASGERFNTQELTAAHLSLPFGTKLLVRNERNGKEVVVRVNDRGPYIKTRIIDLSQAAARALGIDGIGKVVIQRLENDSKARKRYRSAD
jgi:rare lipoprotein A